jgi:NitT/TauT family transport system ATP-binding protein
MPLEFFRDLLREHFPDQEVEQQLETALNWGRYSDILSYDRQADRIRLYEPAAPVEAAPQERE